MFLISIFEVRWKGIIVSVKMAGRGRSCSRYHSLKSPNIRSPSGAAADIYRWASQGTSSFVESKSGLGPLGQSHQMLFRTRLVSFFIRRVISMRMIDGFPYSFFTRALTRILNLFPYLLRILFPLPASSSSHPEAILFARYSRFVATVAT